MLLTLNMLLLSYLSCAKELQNDSKQKWLLDRKKEKGLYKHVKEIKHRAKTNGIDTVYKTKDFVKFLGHIQATQVIDYGIETSITGDKRCLDHLCSTKEGTEC